ncbi:MAG: bifunctional phosphoribosyl-AMP cyclohydrolase/phosphoribosyl-ATP diphosphatase [Bacteroidetes bacterium GWF2_38_335]|nr:MAG: bifunctional phosphoribosyl-AMP cyclohydrolase/phosphoribosyl-ATP diphosphatase [Bacteroidetes bacterium GWF2_38_335]OFY77721.1 MAG: bifunctional phosphoribosyl-AMP cyclohydrolase/phosphoribosyl-ATP diphosphatase [Bacteroidetes bacterium RIFOXYA12_FULL_38_20]HBS89120.1 bifunctional phosphoribosyl-AMP cyclohydrolase/phosphoribosyl-ATP diphosphatase [Bacteroidales bacterium]
MQPDFKKQNGLIPALIQDDMTGKVLMLGYMNEQAWEKTKIEKRVTFYSRSKQQLWTKGETSGNFLEVKQMLIDCDNDCLLIKATPLGPVCHTGADTCFGEENSSPVSFLLELEELINDRKRKMPEGSYTTSLFQKGINKIAQKVGEEAVELVIEAKDNNRELFLNEAADLMYHFLVLLAEKNVELKDVINELKKRGCSIS